MIVKKIATSPEADSSARDRSGKVRWCGLCGLPHHDPMACPCRSQAVQS